MNRKDFIHPEDAAALNRLESIPGFATLVKKFYALGLEKMCYGTNMASNIRLSENQLPELYKLLPPICQKLGIAEPEFYLEMNPMPNAYTFGDTKIFITLTSGLVEMMSEDELIAVIAHECGHILCRHTIYHNMARMLFIGANAFGLLGSISAPIKYYLYYWWRKSELSCDRVSAIITDPDTVSRVMVRLSGGPKSITQNVNIKEWVKQADLYEEIRNDGLWNKALQAYAVLETDHPFSAVRVREILKWSDTEQYKTIKSYMSRIENNRCPKCGKHIDNNWSYCRSCGYKLN